MKSRTLATLTALLALCSVTPAQPADTAKPSDMVLSNETIRVRFHRPGPGKFKIFPLGYTGYTIDLKTGSEWFPMARAAYFTAFSYRTGWGRDWLGYVVPGQGELRAVEHKAVFTDTKLDFDGVTWQFTFEFTLKPGSHWVDVTYTAKPDKQSKLLLLWGPRLYAGDGSFGAAKDEALLPGLDYLGPNDRSSANPALAPDAQMWFAPTPAKITIPLMTVVHGGKMIGLMWDPMQKWYAGETCPTAVFASPNWIEDKPNHLMGLYVPSIPEFAAENGFRAHTPAIIEAGQPVSISCRIFAAPGKHVTDAVDLYLRSRGGLPAPQAKPMDYDAFLNMSVTALTGDAWDAKAGGWPIEYTGNPAHGPWLQPSLLLIESGRIVKDSELAKRAAELGRSVIAKHVERPLALALRVGSLTASINGEKSVAERRLKSQNQDGSWSYVPTDIAEGGLSGLCAPPEPGVIAPEGFKSQGITAGELAALFEYVKITGDEAALKACLKGLGHLAGYAIPFPYMQPECPQSPSLHGSYLALRCYLAAYEITGDKKHLDRAVYWAKTGLPFIYLWSLGPQEVKSGYIHCAKKLYLPGDQLYENPTRDPMLYGGLYGYGSSQFSHHWYGLLVQWIPLVYAQDLAQLAKHDHTMDWNRIADGIMTSTLWQVFDKPPYAGFMPDAFSLDSWVPSGPAFSPGLMLQTLMPVHYCIDWKPQTTIVRDVAVRCHITSSVQAQDARLASGKLSFAISDPNWPFTRAIVAGIRGKAEVRVDGEPIPKVSDLESKDECCSDGPASTILIKVKSGDSARKIEVRFP